MYKAGGLHGCDECTRRRIRQSGTLACPAPHVIDEDRGSERSGWLIAASIYAFSAVLALAAAALCLLGPLESEGPLRTVMPQVAMFIVISVLWIVTDLLPVYLHYRGNTYDFVLEEVPLLIGLVFLSPNLLVLSAVCVVTLTFTVLRRKPLLKVAFNVAATALSTRSPPSSTGSSWERTAR